MPLFRLIRIVFHLFAGLAICAFVFPLVDEMARQEHIKAWSKKLLSICRVRVEIDDGAGLSSDRPALLVANHVSWLDIFVFNSVQPHRFVAKSDIRAWPLIGWLCARTGTIFIARGRLRDVRRIFEDLVTSIRNGEHVAFFPEGTTSAQGKLLPFHANLFEAAIDARASVRPCALRYLDRGGELHPAVDFVGDMTFAESMLAILRGPEITVHLKILPLLEAAEAHRRDLANAARSAIAGALGHSG